MPRLGTRPAVTAGLLGLVWVLAGCQAGGKDVDLYVAVERPAERSLPAGVKAIAITAFNGVDAQSQAQAQMASGILVAKLNETIGPMGTGQCKIVERVNMKDLLKETDLADAGITDPATAAKAGKLLNADTVIFGTIQARHNDERASKEEADPIASISARAPVTKTVNTIRRTVSVSMTFKMVKVETGEIALTKTSSPPGYDSGPVAEKSSGSLLSVDEASKTLVRKCVGEFYNLISPHVECHAIILAACKTEAGQKGQSLAEAGQYPDAAQALAAAAAAKPDDVEAIYDLGVVNMMLGDVAAARGNLFKAKDLNLDKKYQGTLTVLTRALEAGNGVKLRPASEQEKADCQQDAKLTVKKKTSAFSL